MNYKILVINPGSTSTRVALYEDERELFSKNIEHGNDLDRFDDLVDQTEFRKSIVLGELKSHGYKLNELAAVMGRGGLLPGLESGGYIVDDETAEILGSDRISQHASNLGGVIAYSIAEPLGIPAYLYDAVTSAKLSSVAKITGFPNVMRQSQCHALNSRAVARKYAQSIGKRYEDIQLIVAHLGGGLTCSVHKDGDIIDSMSDDDGPFSPERSGSVPLLRVIEMCFSGNYTFEEMKKKVRGKGGMKAHLGTSDCRAIEKMIDAGDEYASLVYQAQAYQIAKAIGLLSIVLCGKYDAIILTGGMAYSKRLTEMVIRYVEFIAPVVIIPGENEMESLALGALRILKGEEQAKKYDPALLNKNGTNPWAK